MSGSRTFSSEGGNSGGLNPSLVVGGPLLLPNSEICSLSDVGFLPVGRPGRDGPDRVLEGSGFERLAARFAQAGTKTAAAEAGVSVRTLHRRLAKRGTTAQALVRRFRRERALRLLREAAGLDEVAEAIGLSGPSAVARFFRREFGRTAGEMREELVRKGRLPHVRCMNCGSRCR
ncbi:MAG: helix-turn-helix domain-containing protein [Thermoanaerobaculia bacterium]